VVAISFNLDDEARNEPPTCLVASQLVVRARSSKWLTLEHLSESGSLWLKGIYFR
jgi:hypothetical protein